MTALLTHPAAFAWSTRPELAKHAQIVADGPILLGPVARDAVDVHVCLTVYERPSQAKVQPTRLRSLPLDPRPAGQLVSHTASPVRTVLGGAGEHRFLSV